MAGENKIGNERFLSLQGQPGLLKTNIERLQRPGVNGTGFWDVGKHGQPFGLRSQCDYASFAEAIEAARRYATLIDEKPVTVLYGGVDLGGGEVVYQVLSVQIAGVTALGSASDGGLNPPSLGWLEAEWTLEPVPAPEPE